MVYLNSLGDFIGRMRVKVNCAFLSMVAFVWRLDGTLVPILSHNGSYQMFTAKYIDGILHTTVVYGLDEPKVGRTVPNGDVYRYTDVRNEGCWLV